MSDDPQRYADSCIAGLNSVVSRQTIVIDPADLPAPLLSTAIGIIERALPDLHLRVREVEAPTRCFAMLPALGRRWPPVRAERCRHSKTTREPARSN